MSAGERPTARPQNRDGAGRPTDAPRVESEGSVERIVPSPRLDRDDGFGAWEPRLRAGSVPSEFDSRITRRLLVREAGRATGIALVLVVAGLVVAVIVWQLAEFIDIMS
jgi:hypothetical protein